MNHKELEQYINKIRSLHQIYLDATFTSEEHYKAHWQDFKIKVSKLN